MAPLAVAYQLYGAKGWTDLCSSVWGREKSGGVRCSRCAKSGMRENDTLVLRLGCISMPKTLGCSEWPSGLYSVQFDTQLFLALDPKLHVF